jgi:hypothetical protein
MVFLTGRIPGPAAPKVAKFWARSPWFFGRFPGNRPGPFMVFSARPPASGPSYFLPTFRRAGPPVRLNLADFSADLQGALTANLEYLKLGVVFDEKTISLRGESLEVACSYRSVNMGPTSSRCNIIFIIVINGAKKESPRIGGPL